MNKFICIIVRAFTLEFFEFSCSGRSIVFHLTTHVLRKQSNQWVIPIGIVCFCPPNHMNKFLKVHIISHIFAYQYIEITIGSVLFKSMYHYKDIHSKMSFLHLTGFHLQCNLIEPFHYHSQPLTFSFQQDTVIFPWVGQKIIPNVGLFPTVFGLFLRLNQSYS